MVRCHLLALLAAGTYSTRAYPFVPLTTSQWEDENIVTHTSGLVVSTTIGYIQNYQKARQLTP
jgi:hypothetical protein